jgi:glycosyltransferase involved in cell wall biosynthesis
MGKMRWPGWMLATRRTVRALQPDILHAHQVATAGWLAAATGYHPCMVTAWGSDLMVGAQRSRLQRLLARWVMRRADYVTCVSEGLARAARELGADPRRLEVAPWGVDTEVYRPSQDREALCRSLGLGPGPIVLSMRSLKAVYNPLDIAQAIPHVLKQHPHAQFVIRSHNSDAHLVSQFQSLIAASGSDRDVRFVGDLPSETDIADLYRVADVAVSVPSSDGTPSSVLEALACGAVPVVSDLPSLREWVEHEREALLVPVHDVPMLSAAICRLLADADLRRELSIQGARMVRERADSRVCMRRNEEIYEALAASVHPSAR